MKISFKTMRRLALAIPVMGMLVSGTPVPKTDVPPPNVLFICIDDLRPDLGCYGNKSVHSPHLDGLAKHATLFNNQFVTVPTCGASRASLLRGKLPSTRQDLKNEACEYRFVEEPDTTAAESFVEYFRRNGYYTVGVGKISHAADGQIYPYSGNPSGKWEMPNSWDEMLFDAGKWRTGWNAFFGYADGESRTSKKHQVKPYEHADVEDEGYPDGLTADLAVKKLDQLAEKRQPFLMAVGFFKPHLPFNAPNRYWEAIDSAEVDLSPTPQTPVGIERASLHNSGEFNAYRLGEEHPSVDHQLSDYYARQLRQSYYACIAYVDAQVGKLIDALKEKGLYENTVVVVWGDHGYHLGDYRIWGKHTLFNWSLRSAFMIKGTGPTRAQVCDQVVSSVDIYPTLVELCGLPKPSGLDGQSMGGLLEDPKQADWRNYAFSYFHNGISLNTFDYHLIRYMRSGKRVVELYDQRTDSLETRNVYSEKSLPNGLLALLEEGDTGLYDQ